MTDIRNLVTDDAAVSRNNPFITRRVRPGAIPYFFPAGETAGSLIDTLAAEHWRGEIIGPHGSGKSTLLHALLPLVKKSGRRVEAFWLRQGQRRLPLEPGQSRHWDADCLIVVDGYEQLGWATRAWLKRTCRRQGAGLLVTSHRGVGLPPLSCTEPSLATAQAVVDHLIEGSAGKITPGDVEESFQRHGGDLRETLFALYDLYQQRQA